MGFEDIVPATILAGICYAVAVFQFADSWVGEVLMTDVVFYGFLAVVVIMALLSGSGDTNDSEEEIKVKVEQD